MIYEKEFDRVEFRAGSNLKYFSSSINKIDINKTRRNKIFFVKFVVENKFFVNCFINYRSFLILFIKIMRKLFYVNDKTC